ncbi:probable membrane protein YetF [Agrilactobacillus composti DSM 18527 = JCM 14202]|nr:probable membrane protein YetF [Agrilactobacillus composti DSM 18527 = JCM 14202]
MFSYSDVALKLILGFLTIVIQINLAGKGNLAPTNALDQLQNYVLGGVIGG